MHQLSGLSVLAKKTGYIFGYTEGYKIEKRKKRGMKSTFF